MTTPYYAQTHQTTAGEVKVTRKTEDSPVVVEQGRTTLTLPVDESMTVTASIAAAAIFHQFPPEAREAFNPANLGKASA